MALPKIQEGLPICGRIRTHLKQRSRPLW